MSENSGFYPSSLFIRNILIQKEKLLIQQSPIKSIPDVALLKKKRNKTSTEMPKTTTSTWVFVIEC